MHLHACQTGFVNQTSGMDKINAATLDKDLPPQEHDPYVVVLWLHLAVVAAPIFFIVTMAKSEGLFAIFFIQGIHVKAKGRVKTWVGT